MKSLILFIINLIIVYSEPIYKYQLRGMFNNEKNKFIESSVKIISNSIATHIITNAKSNITHTTFDFSCNNNIQEKINKITIESTNLYLSLYPLMTHDDSSIREYTNKITQQFRQRCTINHNFDSNNIHYPDYLSNQYIITHDKGGINILTIYKYPKLSEYYTLLNLYNISDDFIINLILNRLKDIFPDINISFINNDLDCCNYYLINYY